MLVEGASGPEGTSRGDESPENLSQQAARNTEADDGAALGLASARTGTLIASDQMPPERFYCFLLRNHRSGLTPSWGTHLLSFSREEDREAFVTRRKSLKEVASEAFSEPRTAASVARYLVMNLPRSGSEIQAREVAFQVLDDETHAAHTLGGVPKTTKVYIEDEGQINEVAHPRGN